MRGDWIMLKTEEDNSRYYYINSEEDLNEAIAGIKESRVLAIDTETTGLNPLVDRVRLLQLAAPDSIPIIIDLWSLKENSLEILKVVLSNSAVKVFQNAKFDVKFLKRANLEVKGQIFDTMLAAKLLWTQEGPKNFKLDELASFYLNENVSKKEQKSDWSKALTESQLNYAAKDAEVLLRLREVLVPRLVQAKLIEAAKLEFDCVYPVADMELNGIFLDLDKWRALNDQMESSQKKAAEFLSKHLTKTSVQMNLFEENISQGINLDSQQQVIKALKQLGIEVSNTSREELLPLAEKYPVVKALLEYRKSAKAVQSFTSSYEKYVNPLTGRIHSEYYQMGTSTGRFSCGNPNLQQIPRGKEFRECFTAEKGNKLIIADYSQIELRVAAEISKDSTMIQAYREGKDLHALTAALVSGKDIGMVTKLERQAAKAINFGLIYAMGSKGLQVYSKDNYGVNMTLEEAEVFRERFFKAYDGIERWHSSIRKQNPKESRTLAGRRRVWAENPGVTNLYNTPVQGTAADITKKALVLLYENLIGTGCKIIATVHDEILVEAPEEMAVKAAEILKLSMEEAGRAYLKLVPVIAETMIGDSWAEK